MLYETCIHINNKHMLITQDGVRFPRRIAWQTFLVKNFTDFLDVVKVKISRYPSVFGGVSLQQHLNLESSKLVHHFL